MFRVSRDVTEPSGMQVVTARWSSPRPKTGRVIEAVSAPSRDERQTLRPACRHVDPHRCRFRHERYRVGERRMKPTIVTSCWSAATAGLRADWYFARRSAEAVRVSTVPDARARCLVQFCCSR
jgi:hypothetical protein